MAQRRRIFIKHITQIEGQIERIESNTATLEQESRLQVSTKCRTLGTRIKASGFDKIPNPWNKNQAFRFRKKSQPLEQELRPANQNNLERAKNRIKIDDFATAIEQPKQGFRILPKPKIKKTFSGLRKNLNPSAKNAAAAATPAAGGAADGGRNFFRRSHERGYAQIQPARTARAACTENFLQAKPGKGLRPNPR